MKKLPFEEKTRQPCAETGTETSEIRPNAEKSAPKARGKFFATVRGTYSAIAAKRKARGMSVRVAGIKARIQLLRTLVAVAVAFLVAFILILCVSKQPFEAFRYLLAGPFMRARYFNQVLVQTVPLAVSGLALGIMLKAGQFNLATEGSFILGGVFAALIAIRLPMPAWIHPEVAVLFGILGGIAICAVPAMTKAFFGISEMVVSLMMNYIALRIGNIVIRAALLDETAGILTTKKFAETALLSSFRLGNLEIQTSFAVMAIAVVAVYIYLDKTRSGYAMRLGGLNGRFAAFSGMSVGGLAVLSQVIGGGLAGGAGAMYTLNNLERYDLVNTFPNKGFDGMIVTILARNNPALIPLAAFFLAYVREGAEIMSRHTDVSVEIMSIIQGVIIILVAGQALFSGLQNKRVIKEVSNG